MSDKSENLDPFERAVRSIVNNQDSRFFFEWLVRNQQEAVRDAASSTSSEDMLKISGRLYEYEYILSSINSALSAANIGEIELYIADNIFAHADFSKKKKNGRFKSFFNFFRVFAGAAARVLNLKKI